MWLKRCLFRVLAKPRIKNKKDMKQQDAALVCFSGGQDSTTCLFWAKKHFSRVEAVCFTYGQKHSLEIEVARKIAADADVPFQLLDVSLISQLDPNCSLTNASIEMDQEKPEDSYPNTFVLLLGMCPTLGTTSSAINGMGMGLATMFVLICSNVVISLIKNLIPDMVRIPSFIVVIASFVTLLQMVMQAYVPGLYATLGLFIPLIVVNCIVLGRAEAFAAKNNAVASMFDGIGMGLGFTIALTLLGAVREFLGTGKIFDLTIMPEEYGMLVFVLAPGAFIALGYLIALINSFKKA